MTLNPQPSTLITPPTYPARPVNGGPLDKALPKTGAWSLEGKYNGWRAHGPPKEKRLFNRKNEPLSINAEFGPALEILRRAEFDWLDYEALERRHGIGRGSLVILDAPGPGTYEQRRLTLEIACSFYKIPVHKNLNEPIPDNSVVLAMRWQWDGAAQLWDVLRQCNTALGCEFYEGVVAKRADSLYPMQLRSPDLEFPFWMKHRWAF